MIPLIGLSACGLGIVVVVIAFLLVFLVCGCWF